MTDFEVQLELQLPSDDSPSGQRAPGVLQEDAGGDREAARMMEALQNTGHGGQTPACFEDIDVIILLIVTSITQLYHSFTVLLKQHGPCTATLHSHGYFQLKIGIVEERVYEADDCHSFGFQRRRSRCRSCLPLLWRHLAVIA